MVKDLQNSIEEMTKYEKIEGTKFSLDIDFPSKIANFMFYLNEANIPEIGKWSMRNIRKLYRRLTRQQIDYTSYHNITIEHQIVIFILGSVPGGVEEKLIVYDQISDILKKTFKSSNELYEKIRNCIESKPRKIKINDKEFLVKGDSVETLKIKEKNEKLKKFTHCAGEAGIVLDLNIKDNIDLSSFYESIFYVLFFHYKEPLLLCGPSGYKSKLAKDISPGASVINFYPEISNSHLIGHTSLVVNYLAKEYYIEQICKICKRDDAFIDLKNELKEYYDEKIKEAIQKKEKQIKELKKKKIEEIQLNEKKLGKKEEKKNRNESEGSSEEEERTKKKKNKKEESEEETEEEDEEDNKKKKKKKDDSDGESEKEEKKKKKKKKIESKEESEE